MPLKILDVIGVVETVVVIAGIAWSLTLWARGIAPALLRLGNGLAKRKIALFAKGENALSLTSLLTDSKLFKEANIFVIGTKDDIGRAEGATIFMVLWHDWSIDIDEILKRKRDKCPLIVYAPYDRGRIPDDEMHKLDGMRHTAVTNFRGRLLNDLVTSMITTSL